MNSVIALVTGFIKTIDYPTLFSGFITATGTGGGNKLPVGWTVTKPTAGRYRIQHNLGLGTNKDLRITVTLFGSNPNAWRIYVRGINSNRFVVHTEDQAGSLVTNAFFFRAELI